MGERMAKRDTTVAARRRAQILDGAERSILDLGWEATTFTTIAARSNVARGALNYFFRDKHDLLLALVGRLFERQVARLERMTAPVEGVARDGAAMIGLIVDRVAESDDEELAAFQLVLAVFDAAPHDPELARQVAAYLAFWRGKLVTLLADGQARGTLRVTDPSATAGWFLAAIHGLAIQRVLGQSRELVRRSAADLWAALVTATDPPAAYSATYPRHSAAAPSES
jgi:AcrR family transcriptional regulator